MSVSLGRITLDSGIVISKGSLGEWRLEGAGCSFLLGEKYGFERAISLLEKPIDEVKLNLGRDFPYVNLIQIGLRHGSDYWIGLALSWVKNISADEAGVFLGDLELLSSDKSISQKNRQSSKKEVRRIISHA
ncbi:hypothetical protein KV580_04315 [Pseudomonas chlororaphis]|nr:hypothetical protein [Pseudomonas chlororaphis]